MKVTMDEGQQLPELIERVKRGDRDAFEELVSRSEDRLESFIARRIRPELRGRIDAAALATETLATAFESIERFAGVDGDSWFAWLAGIAKNVVLMEIERLRRRRAVRLDRDLALDQPSPSRHMRREERFERLRDALKGLSGDHYEVIRLCRIEGLSIREAAQRMGRSVGAAKMLLWRALSELKGRFGETESLGLPDRRLDSEGGSDE